QHIAGVDVRAGREDVARAEVVVRVVVLHRAVLHVPVEIESAAVGHGLGGVVVALVVLEGDAVGSRGPDADGRGAGGAVVVRDAALDNAVVDVGDIDPAAGHLAGRAVAAIVERGDVLDDPVLIRILRRAGRLEPAV